MSRHRSRRRRHQTPHEDLLTRARNIPARWHVRWLLILVVVAVAMWTYGRLLMTAGAMPPSKVPAVGHQDATSRPTGLSGTG
ncbi:hypothetical protein [Streptomyces qinglanensis]|uniref:Uncharacterized protein n=1 Tax=Streptomyces qinglanensis TaxID=943816 RepID=A0A1H9UV85_9ACTN|nr:hypothetical protein [Streptomyces qinglanensis]SES13385.1 hypothetical protein SAMN05421870_109190 [Streptomyces qinglanensis]